MSVLAVMFIGYTLHSPVFEHGHASTPTTVAQDAPPATLPPSCILVTLWCHKAGYRPWSSWTLLL